MTISSFLRGCAASREIAVFTRSREAAKGLRFVRSIMFLALALLGGASPSWADSSMAVAPYANTALADPAKEAEAKALMESVRCLVCQGRSLIRKRIAAGEQPEAIRAYLIRSYGDWVSYKPVFDWATAPLWIAPLLFVMTGLWLARGRFRRRKR
jgi:cytochrome c-type biogenesis protein CcmH